MNCAPGLATSGRVPRPLMCLSAPIPSVGLEKGSPSRPPVLVNRVAPLQPTYIRMRQPPQQPLQYKSYTLKTQAKYQVFVSYVADGPLSFSLQLIESHPHLTALMRKLNSSRPEHVTTTVYVGMMCLARFAEDSSLCRALVMQISSKDSCRVYYVDYGNSEEVPFKDIFELPTEFALPKVLSYRFVLSGFQGKTVTEEEKEVFKELVDRMEATVIVLAIDDTSKKYVGDLLLNGNDVAVLVKEKLMKKQQGAVGYSTALWPAVGSKQKVFITFVGESGKFFVQDSSTLQDLNLIMSAVQKYCTEGKAHLLQPEHKVVGMPCCAKDAENTWFRARIVEFCRDYVQVLFVDFGNRENVHFSELRKISPELVSQLEVRSIQCFLHGYIDDAREKLLKLKGDFVTMEVITQTECGLIVNLLDSNENGVVTISSPLQLYTPSPQNDRDKTDSEARDMEVEVPLGWRRRKREVRFADAVESFPTESLEVQQISRRDKESFRRNEREDRDRRRHERRDRPYNMVSAAQRAVRF